MRLTYLASLAIVALCASSVVAGAQDASPPAPQAMNSMRTACADDVKQFCSGVEPGQWRIVKCLRDNEDKLSQSCKDARAAMRAMKEHKSAPQ